MYVYKRSEPQLFTVGFYDPDGGWHPDSDWNDKDKATKRVRWLNGGNDKNSIQKRISVLEMKSEKILRCEQCDDALDDWDIDGIIEACRDISWYELKCNICREKYAV